MVLLRRGARSLPWRDWGERRPGKTRTATTRLDLCQRLAKSKPREKVALLDDFPNKGTMQNIARDNTWLVAVVGADDLALTGRVATRKFSCGDSFVESAREPGGDPFSKRCDVERCPWYRVIEDRWRILNASRAPKLQKTFRHCLKSIASNVLWKIKKCLT